MLRRARLLVLLLVAALVAGAVALVFLERPALVDDRGVVEDSWAKLRTPLMLRYQKLDAALVSFEAAAGGTRSVTVDLRHALAAWRNATRNGDAGEQAATAGVLEGEATRLAADARLSDRFKGVQALTTAL